MHTRYIHNSIDNTVLALARGSYVTRWCIDAQRITGYPRVIAWGVPDNNFYTYFAVVLIICYNTSCGCHTFSSSYGVYTYVLDILSRVVWNIGCQRIVWNVIPYGLPKGVALFQVSKSVFMIIKQISNKLPAAGQQHYTIACSSSQ